MPSTQKQRGLSTAFLSDLKQGILTPLLERMHHDTSLDLGIRHNCLNVYYRGGSLLRVELTSPGEYKLNFNKGYFLTEMLPKPQLPNPRVNSPDALAAWMKAVPHLKDTMDLWFGVHPKDERQLQQLVAWENNASPWANGTDYFVIDIEYDNHDDARFDIVALQWHSDAAARKLTGSQKPKLTIIEMKAGDGALKGSSGLVDHMKQFGEFLRNSQRVADFKSEMLTVFQQKRDLGLIPALRRNTNVVTAVDDAIDVAFLLAGHDSASGKLQEAINEIASCRTEGYPQPLFCATAFAGFGLYVENVLPLATFQERYARQIRR